VRRASLRIVKLPGGALFLILFVFVLADRFQALFQIVSEHR
jgi:hypothetical protein